MALPLVALAAALGIRCATRLFLARDPCVQFLYVLVGIKFIESRNTRDGTLLVCLALFLAVTQFFYTQTIFAAVIAIAGTVCARRRARRAARPIRAARTVGAQLAAPGAPDAAGYSARRTAVRAVSTTRRSALGFARRHRRTHRAFGPYVARLDQRTVAIRRGCFPRRLSWTARLPAARTLLARPGVRSLQRSGMERAVPAAGRHLRAARRAGHRLHRDARTARQAMAVCARTRGRAAAAAHR